MVKAQEKDDFICVGPGENLTFSEDGNDHIDGSDGDDGLSGDMLEGDAGNNDLRDGNDDDTANGNDGDNNIFGDAGNDMLSGNGVGMITTTCMEVLTPTSVMRDPVLICAIRSRQQIIVKIDTIINSRIIKASKRRYSHAYPLSYLSVLFYL